jgi:predicted nicotinamide N-methyase
VPEVTLMTATESTPLWREASAWFGRGELEPPFWAFAWAGGLALSRAILDGRLEVTGRVVADFGSGSGIVAIAAAKAGAQKVIAYDVDRLAIAAIGINASLNGVRVEARVDSPLGRDLEEDMLLLGDVHYEAGLGRRVATWARGQAARGVEVCLGDPGRSYFDDQGTDVVARYRVSTTREIESGDEVEAAVYRLVSAETSPRVRRSSSSR